MAYFGNILKYEGKHSDNPLAYRYYNPDEIILGKPMREHLRYSVCYWHTLCYQGLDPFGQATMQRPWDLHTDIDGSLKGQIEIAKKRVAVFFELLETLDIDFFAFHDRDIAPEGETLSQTNEILDEIVAEIETAMQRSGKKLLWGTANLFSNARFVHGAATSCNPEVFAYAAAQVKKALEVTSRLGGEGYVFWGGREGYDTLLNTDMRLELGNLAYLLEMAHSYAQKIGFRGALYIEPKPKEPTKHQYDFDAAAVLAFLRSNGLERHFRLNIESNHATLAGHSMQHELRYALDNGIFGSVDANQGDLLLGWDTDEFPYSVPEAALTMYEILRGGGFTTGGLNFDAHVRRGSFTPNDLLHGHILGIDTYAQGLRIAARLIEDGVLEERMTYRYRGYTEGIGADIRAKRLNLEDLERYALSEALAIKNESGGQEQLQRILCRYIDSL